MQEPADNAPDAPQIDVVIEVTQSAIVIDQAGDASVMQSSLQDDEAIATDEPLNRLERIAADLGAWLITFTDHWHLQSSPWFVVDNHPIGSMIDRTPPPADDSSSTPTQ